MLGAQGLSAGSYLYHATSAVTRDLGFSGLIRRTVPFSCLLRHTRGYGGSILTQILTGYITLEVDDCSLLMSFHLKGFYVEIFELFFLSVVGLFLKSM
jgi:hypothetical protein